MPGDICLHNAMKIILASASPRRKELLAYLGYSFEVLTSAVDEEILSGETPEEYVARVSREKCLSVFHANTDAIVLAGDTSVVVDSKILGKPENRLQAKEMISLLSGRSHYVYSAFSIMGPKLKEVLSGFVSTEVIFRRLTEGEIDSYITTDEPYDKAGGYAIQGIAGKFIPEIRGSVSGVIGLPLSEVDESLRKAVELHS
jgi:septum formation protein